MTVRAACARVGAAILPAQVACCPPAVTVKATRDDVRHGVVVGGGPPPARCDPPSAARATHRAAPDVTLLQRQLSGLLDTTAMCARPDRAPGMLSTLFASTTSTVAALFDGLRTRATISRGLTAPTAVSTPTAPTEAPANGLPAVSMPPQPPLPPTGIQLFIAPPLASVAAPVAASDTSTAADTPTDGSFAAGVATWVASLPRPRIGDGPTLPIGELRRRLERWRAHHRLTRTGLLLLTIAAPVGVAFVITACIEIFAGR